MPPRIAAQAASSSSAVAGAVSAAASAPTGWQLFRQGVLTNALNPKVALFFLALLPQFIDGDAPHKTLAFLFLGAWFVVQGTAFLVAFVLLVAPLRRWRPSRQRRADDPGSRRHPLHGARGEARAGAAALNPPRRAAAFRHAAA